MIEVVSEHPSLRLLPDAGAELLLSAVVSRHLELAGVRVLVIKGAPLAMAGLRSPRESGDVDLLVAPAEATDAALALVSAGFEVASPVTVWSRLSSHSTTYVSPHWSLAVDLHYEYPGFGVDDASAFEWLWSRRVRLPMAGLVVSVPSVGDSAVMIVLHDRRTTRGKGSAADSYADLAARLQKRGHVGDLLTAAGALGVVRDIREALLLPCENAGLADVTDTANQSVAWRLRVASNGRFWAVAAGRLRRYAPRERLQLLVDAFWVPARDIRVGMPMVPDNGTARMRYRMMRWARGVAGVTSTVVAAFVAGWRRVSRRCTASWRGLVGARR